MSGFAITAGSNPIFPAIRGRLAPTSFAIIIVPTRVSDITKAIQNAFGVPLRSNSINLIKFAAASVTPQRNATLNSFHQIRSRSLNSTSPSESARITDTEA